MMKRFLPDIILLSVLLSLAACHKSKQPAEAENKRLGYILVGDKNSLLAPVSVKFNSENVLIKLKDSAPIPQTLSVEAGGGTTPFICKIDGHTVVIPVAYRHLQLRLVAAGAPSVDVSYTLPP